MVIRTALAALALVELVAPRPLVDFWMGLVSKTDDVELRPWVYTVTRLEGLVILLWLAKEQSGQDEPDARIRVKAEG